MTDPNTSHTLAYHQAWTALDLDQAMTYIADDITCDAPGAQISGAQQYRGFLSGFMTQLTGVQTVAAFGDDTTAVLFYYPHIANVSDAPTAECFYRRRQQDHPKRACLRPGIVRPAAALRTGRPRARNNKSRPVPDRQKGTQRQNLALERRRRARRIDHRYG